MIFAKKKDLDGIRESILIESTVLLKKIGDLSIQILQERRNSHCFFLEQKEALDEFRQKLSNIELELILARNGRIEPEK